MLYVSKQHSCQQDCNKNFTTNNPSLFASCYVVEYSPDCGVWKTWYQLVQQKPSDFALCLYFRQADTICTDLFYFIRNYQVVIKQS